MKQKQIVKKVIRETISKLFEAPGELASIAPDAYKKLNDVIQELLHQYGGGRPFFDALDDQIKSATNEFMIHDLMKGLEGEYICSSGGFGDKLYELYDKKKINCRELLIFGGKISTNKTGITPYYPKDFVLDKKEFVYLDDSYFSGRTANTIDNFLDNFNSRIKLIRVVYDGSKEKLSHIQSIYRYY